MVGEIEYYKNNHAEAIAYFKKSATLHSKATYMPTLLLHTAIAMEKSGEKKMLKHSMKQLLLSIHKVHKPIWQKEIKRNQIIVGYNPKTSIKKVFLHGNRERSNRIDRV